MSPWTSAIGLVRRHPWLVVGWLTILVLPSVLAFFPLDVALAPYLDLRPAAAALVRAPADDGLLGELLHAAPSLLSLGVVGLILTCLLGVPAMCLLAGHVAAVARETPLPPRLVAARALGLAVCASPLRILPAAGAIAIGLGARRAQTLDHALPWVATAIAFYLIASSGITVLVDLARGAALADLGRGLFGCLGEALRMVRRRPTLFIELCLFDLLLLACLVAPAALCRPLGIFSGWTPLVAYGALAVRALGGVLGVAAAATTGAASRSA